jgi:hypothetical protein
VIRRWYENERFLPIKDKPSGRAILFNDRESCKEIIR